MKHFTKLLVLLILLILNSNCKLFGQACGEPEDTIFFEKFEEIGMELKSEVKIKPKYSFIHNKKWDKVELTQQLINTNESNIIKVCKLTCKSYGDAD
jgi:hypothetical protein